jgi:N-acetylmuramate 1-kinase
MRAFDAISGSIAKMPFTPPVIVMDAPPQSEPVEPFIAIAELLQKAGLHVPRVLEKNTSDGFLLLSDLGSTTYLAALKIPMQMRYMEMQSMH